MPEPSPSLSSAREEEVVVVRVVPNEGFPSGSGHEAGTEHGLSGLMFAGKKLGTIIPSPIHKLSTA